MDSRFNIPAPAVDYRGRDVCVEQRWRLKVPVPQGDGEASAEPDAVKHAPRKAWMDTKAPVPETDTGGWA